MPWMHVTFVFVILLIHTKCLILQLQNDEVKYSTIFMRLWTKAAHYPLPCVLVVLKASIGLQVVGYSFLYYNLGFKFYKKRKIVKVWFRINTETDY
jgi:putative membrane protein